MTKKALITGGIALALLFAYFGAYKPYIKATRYINALRTVGTSKSVAAFEELFETAFAFNSPIGDEELVKFFSSDITETISQADQPENVARELVRYATSKLFEDDVLHLISGSRMHAVLWQRFGQDADYEAAVAYLLKARALGPKLPPVLYSLLDLYIAKGDSEKAREVASTILQYWPNDGEVKKIAE